MTDFGIARIAGGFETAAGVIAGSPAYTAPEVLEGIPPTPASDVYSLGATLFCALTGHAAFERRSGEQVIAQFLRVTSQPIPDLRTQGLPADVAATIERAMASGSGGSSGDRGRIRRGVACSSAPQRRHRRRDAPPRRAGRGAPKSPVAPSVRRDTGGTPTFQTPPTPATKYRPPVPTRSLVARSRLTDVLRAGGRRRLILIHAPSGFGKSTLAAQWREELSSVHVAVAWLTVDDDDNNAVWFLAHLLESIRRVRPALAESLGQVLEEHGDDACRYVLTLLIDEIHEKDDRIAVVIDDWHRVSDSQTSAALGFLIGQRMPPSAGHRYQLVSRPIAIGQVANPRRVGRDRFRCFAFRYRRGGLATQRCKWPRAVARRCGGIDHIDRRVGGSAAASRTVAARRQRCAHPGGQTFRC